MPNNLQNIGSLKFHTISQKLISRIKLSPKIISELGWNENNSYLYGFFRSYGELLCAPHGIQTADGLHPFSEILDFLDFEIPNTPPEIGEIPSLKALAVAERIFTFESTWSQTGKQVDLKLGKKNIGKLLGQRETSTIYMCAWAGILILASEEKFRDVLYQNILNTDL